MADGRWGIPRRSGRVLFDPLGTFSTKGFVVQKEKVVVFSVDSGDGPEGFIIVSADSQVRAIPVVGSVHGDKKRELDDYEIVSKESPRVLQSWERASYTQLSEVAVLFDPGTGRRVRALKEYPSGKVVRYIASAPGPRYSSGMTAEEALSKLGPEPSSQHEATAEAVPPNQIPLAAQLNSLLPSTLNDTDFLNDQLKNRRKTQGEKSEKVAPVQYSPKKPSGSSGKG